LLALERCRAEALRRSGQPKAAAAALTAVRKAERSLDGGAFSVGGASTLRELARCADELGHHAEAIGYYERLRAAADGVLDPTHVVLLRADLDQARRLLAASDIAGAGRLVSGLLDRRPLAHGRPALEDAHPTAAAARRLAEAIGEPVSGSGDQDGFWGEE
jgi:hypothetical protein